MGILSNTVSICHFQVAGDIPADDLFTWVSERLAKNGFRAIDQTAEELSTGWVHVDDHRDSSFGAPRAFWRDHYLVFTLRRDQRKLPAALLKAYQQVYEHEWLAKHEGASRVPKQEREAIKEKVRLDLLTKTLPVPSSFDAVWDTKSGIVTFTSLSPKNIELFEAAFKRSFEGLRLVALHPFSRAEALLEGEALETLAKANRAGTESALDLIKSNQWIGWEFLLWLMHRTMNDSSEYRVCRPGHAEEGEPFAAYLNDKLVLVAGSEEGTQKVTVAGPQDHFGEVKSALKNGKQITEATIYLEKDENSWKATLKGELFHFGSFRAPGVKIEKDDLTDQLSEKEAVFYERMYLLEQGLQLFDSLFADFLSLRLGSGWSDEEEGIRRWLDEETA